MAQESSRVTDTQIQEAADYILAQIKEKGPKTPKIAIVCGSGLSGLADDVKDPLVIPYESIPNFPTTTVCGHKNQMVIGILSKTRVIILQGRFHFYEGLRLDQCTMYVKVLDIVGVEFLIVSNAAGGVNPEYKVGDIMMIRDHLYISGLAGGSPLLPQDDAEGVQFKNKKPIYAKNIIGRCQDLLADIDYEGNIQVGVYACLSGPNYETIAEVKFLQKFGADAVGMSTVPEVLIANDCGIQVVAFSLITNECIQDYDSTAEPNHEEVMEVCSHRSESLKKFAANLADYLRCCCVCPGT